MNSDEKRILWIGLFLVVGILVCVCVSIGIGAWTANSIAHLLDIPATENAALSETDTTIMPSSPTSEPQETQTQPTQASVPPQPSTGKDAAPGAESQPSGGLYAAMQETLSTLETTDVPLSDPIDLAVRFNKLANPPVQLDSLPPVYQLGDQESFWVTDSDLNQSYQVQASLAYITDHVYFWIDNQVSNYSEKKLKNLVETFEGEIYPTTRAFFGSEWTPGVDNDPHLYILYANGIGNHVTGYFSSADAYLPSVREYANGHEMFLLNAELLDLGEEYAYAVLAHEFQHMIHWYVDRNEETWMNEGLASLAMQVNGYGTGGGENAYLANPDIQLNDWPEVTPNRGAYYGASYLFMSYFLDRFGEQATKALVAHPANGLVSMDKVLESLGVREPDNNRLIRADDVFRDWVIASYLQDDSVGDGRFDYKSVSRTNKPGSGEAISVCPTGQLPLQVNQYGVDYIQIRCQGEYNLSFDGAATVSVLPTAAHSGSSMFYSNKGDESHTYLERAFDFSQHTGDLTLSYWTWFDIEDDYDYAYLTASLDGKTWQTLSTPSGTPENPVGNSYGWAYNGVSGGQGPDDAPRWIQEEIDLSQFAGKKVWLRFEYITDAAVNGDGLLLDDIAIPQTGYSVDFETDDGGWQAEGFVRIQNQLPQSFLVSVIRFGKEISVEQIPLDEQNRAAIPLVFDQQVDEVILVVSGSSRHTRQTAEYAISIQPR